MNAIIEKKVLIIRVALRGLVAFAFVWLIMADINPSGVLNVSYDLCKLSPYISELSPHGRVLDIEKNVETGRDLSYCYQKMAIDPVYVDVRLPQRYDSVRTKIVYKKPNEQPFSLGVRKSLQGWNWDIQQLNNLPANKEWQTGIVEFNLKDVPLDNRRLRFILSAPGLDISEQEIVIKEISMAFEKPALSFHQLKRWLSSFI